MAARSGLSKTSVLHIIQYHLYMTKVSARWVAMTSLFNPKAASHLLGNFGNEEEVLQSIVKVDETMVLYYDPLSKRESMEWHKCDEETTQKAYVTQSTKKSMATISCSLKTKKTLEKEA
ncbi:hypothetical protein C0J52_15902 [Blattella germanica]|nr:hypothetical protein C0J52_15902 [Blattella germanica]